MALARQILKSTLQAMVPRSHLMVRGPQRQNTAFLTFDDGPHPVNTPPLLEALEKAGVRATFFLIGQNVERHPDLVRQLYAAGHVLGHHTFRHLNPSSVSATQLMREIEQTDRLFTQILGSPIRLFRPPWGKLSAAKFAALWAGGKQIILWNKDPRDCDASESGVIATWFERNPTAAGDIVLMHDDHPHAASVLPGVIAEARSRGIEFTTIGAGMGGK